MELLASLFVGQPPNILAVAALFLGGYLILRSTSFGAGRHPRVLLVAAGGWTLYAVLEWVVAVRTPELNIRVDLFVIWPVLTVVSACVLFRSLR